MMIMMMMMASTEWRRLRPIPYVFPHDATAKNWC